MWMPKPPGPRSLAGCVMSGAGAGADVGSNGRPPSTNANVNVP
jgi:hypothetical protein